MDKRTEQTEQAPGRDARDISKPPKKRKKDKPEPKYLVKHPGPNRAMRRRIEAQRIAARQGIAAWMRDVAREGKDPQAIIQQVLAKRRGAQKETFNDGEPEREPEPDNGADNSGDDAGRSA